MTYEALIAFAPCTTVERLNDERWANRAPDRILYDGSGLQVLPARGEKSIPLLVDHDEGRVVGRCEKLMRLDVDGPWMCATATLSKRPPWLKRGTPASFELLAPIWDSFGNNIVRRGLVREVSLLSPGVEPMEPLARVLSVKPVEKPAPTVIRRSPALAAQRTSKHSETEELRRRIEWLGDHVPMETILEHMKIELGYERRW